jgi:hypothetical protein
VGVKWILGRFTNYSLEVLTIVLVGTFARVIQWTHSTLRVSEFLLISCLLLSMLQIYNKQRTAEVKPNYLIPCNIQYKDQNSALKQKHFDYTATHPLMNEYRDRSGMLFMTINRESYLALNNERRTCYTNLKGRYDAVVVYLLVRRE